ncbi:hypothetical protein [Clostridium manihotivorum]|uniref:Uncharacterized protein n=1 Tax=Clostridium manihotivorum TaxID=2320868 RepID=A0A410DMG1_9CLOT|nr:hypothetical protein [Clostridium manihotivorum]QAA30257.1 hypothetical protein C1I91_00335 [Clostridium manihotivorum]
MDEDLLAKILLSILLVGYYEEIDDEDVLNENVHKDKYKLDSLEDIVASYEKPSSGGNYEEIGVIDSGSRVDNYSKTNDVDKIEELGVKEITSMKPSFSNAITLSSEVIGTKEVDNSLDISYGDSYSKQEYSDYNDNEDSVNDDGFEGGKISNVNVLLAAIKVPISIEECFYIKREKIYRVEDISCDIKEISGNLLLLRQLKEKSKVKLFYRGILRIKVKYLSIDRIENKSLLCNTKDLIFYSNFSGTINTYIETRMIEDSSSVNIPTDIDLLGNKFNGRCILEEPTTLYDIKEQYYRGVTIIGDMSLNIALLKELYATI